MLIEFVFKNFLSIREEQVFSMVATPLKEKFESADENLITFSNKVFPTLLKSAVIYGANASGKSNVINAFHFFKRFVLQTSLTKPAGRIPFTPFILNEKSMNQNSSFEISFIQSNRIYRYGFEVNQNEVAKEWLFLKINRESPVFYRKGNRYEIPHKYKVLNTITKKKMIRPDALLLTVAAQFNDEIAVDMMNWFEQFNILSGISDFLYKDFSVNCLSDKEMKNEILKLLQFADTGITDLKVLSGEEDTVSVAFKGDDPDNPVISKEKSLTRNLLSIKEVVDEKGIPKMTVELPFDKFESEGTKKYFHLLGPVLDTLKQGKVLIIDELDTRLHPLLTQRIIKLFNSTITNQNNAQLVFTTQDTHLMSSDILRRDQIWFTEKDRYGATSLYSLSDFKKGKVPRNDERLEKNYMAGKYGAVPVLNDFDEVFETRKK